MAINTTTVECSKSPSLISPNIKQETMDKLSPMQQTANVSIAFSITNILSNNFGNNNKVIGEKRNGFSLRPHDDGSPSPKKLKFDRRFNDDDSNGGADDDEEIDVTDDHAQVPSNGAIDFSGALSNSSIHRFAHSILSPQQHAHHLQQQQLLSHYQAAMAVAQQSLQRASVHGFMESPLDAHHRTPIYPEFYHQNQQQALAKQYQQYYQTSLLSDNALSKYAPLGNLCKTVSQIGQSPSTGPTPNTTKLASPALSEPSPIKKSLSRPSSQTNTSKALSESGSNATALKSPSIKTNDAPSTGKTSRFESMDSGMESSDDTKSETSSNRDDNGSQLYPAWIYCTRYSDRPSSGPRYRKPKTPKVKGESDEKRPRTAFSSEQLARLKREFNENHYLNESRRQQLSSELGLNEAQIKIWFQNKRAKIKKSSGQKNPLAMQLMAQGLYNHSTVALTKEEEELEMRMNGQL